MDDISTRYVTLPELSVEGFQANVAVVWATAVACRSVGWSVRYQEPAW